jgi:hypothetical protein
LQFPDLTCTINNKYKKNGYEHIVMVK